jgi:hypothetical protein
MAAAIIAQRIQRIQRQLGRLKPGKENPNGREM